MDNNTNKTKNYLLYRSDYWRKGLPPFSDHETLDGAWEAAREKAKQYFGPNPPPYLVKSSFVVAFCVNGINEERARADKVLRYLGL